MSINIRMVEATKPLRDTQGCKVCDCEQYVEELVIGNFPTCQCGHTENSHWVPGKKTAASVRWEPSPEDPNVKISDPLNGMVGEIHSIGAGDVVDYDFPMTHWLWVVCDEVTGKEIASGKTPIEGEAYNSAVRIMSTLPSRTSAYISACPTCGASAESALPVESGGDAWMVLECGQCGTVWDDDRGTTWGSRGDYDIERYGSKKTATTTALWPVTGYGDLVHVVLGNPEDTGSVPEATKTALCGQTPWGFRYWRVMPFDGEDYRPVSNAEDARQVTCPTCRRAAETSVRTASRKTARGGSLQHTASDPMKEVYVVEVEPGQFYFWLVDTEFDTEILRAGGPFPDVDAAWREATRMDSPSSRKVWSHPHTPWDVDPEYWRDFFLSRVKTGSRQAARPGDTRKGLSALLGATVAFPDGKTGTIMDLAPITNPDGPKRVEREITNYNWRSPRYREVEIPTQKAIVPGIPASKIEACWVESGGQVYWAAVHVPDMTVVDSHLTPQRLVAKIRQAVSDGTRVPAQVDTLRDDACPVCGSVDYRGENCNSCGYIKPPVIFHDPDTDKARLDELRNPTKPSVDLACDSCGAVFPAQAQPQGVVATAAVEDEIPEPPPLPGGKEKQMSTLPPDDEDDIEDEPEEEAVEEAQEAPNGSIPGGPYHSPQQGDLCPSCGQGTLLPKDEIDGVELDDLEQAVGNTPEPALSEEEEEPEEDVENPFAATATRARSPRGRQKEKSMTEHPRPARPRQALHEALRSQEGRLSAQARLIRRQAATQQILVKQNESLRRAVVALAQSAGNKAVVASLTRRANDAQNHDPVATTDEQAAAPEATTDVETTSAPVATDAVTPEATTTVTESGVALDTAPLNELVDVNQEHPQTGNPVGTTTDMTGQVSQAPVSNPIEESGWTNTASKDEGVRTWAALNLARHRVAAGLSTEDPVVLAQSIEKDASLSVEAMETEIATLDKVAKVSKGTEAPRNLVPRSAQRVPSLAPATASGPTGESSGGVDLSDTLM